jgi:hypothetical protein
METADKPNQFILLGMQEDLQGQMAHITRKMEQVVKEELNLQEEQGEVGRVLIMVW